MLGTPASVEIINVSPAGMPAAVMIKTMLFTGSLKLNVYVKAPAAPRWIELDGVVYPQEVQGLGYGATDPCKS
jgi:hypothetical protein